MTNAVAYFRFSPKPIRDDAPDMDSIALQRASCEALCAARGWPLRAAHEDRAVSGASDSTTDLAACPGLLAALASLCRGDVLVVARFDRLARDEVRLALVLRELERKGCRLVSAAGDVPESIDSPTLRLLLGMLALVGGHAKALTGQRTSAAHRARIKAGYRVQPVHLVPWGTKATKDGRTVECAHEASVRARILALRAEGLSYPDIAERLWMEGIRPRKDRRSRRYSASAVRRIVGKATP